LDESLQAQAIRKIRGSPALARELREKIGPKLFMRPAPNVLAANRLVVENIYGPTAYGYRLEKIYNIVCGVKVSAARFDAGGLRERFLAPERFRLLRT